MADYDFSDDNFDATKVDPNEGFAIPAGEYLAVVIDSEKKTTKAGDGTYLQIELQIIEGAHKNQRVWDRFNRKNPSVKAVAIANRMLAALCLAVNVPKPNRSSELHNKPVRIVLKVKEYQGTLQNEVVRYKSVNEIGEEPEKFTISAKDLEDTAPWTK